MSYTAEAFIFDGDQRRIGCQTSFKALGMKFSNRPTMDLHVESIKKGFRMRIWTLRNLKNCGFTCQELVRVTIIRLVADYRCVVYHSSLTDEQDKDLDRL